MCDAFYVQTITKGTQLHQKIENKHTLPSILLTKPREQANYKKRSNSANVA